MTGGTRALHVKRPSLWKQLEALWPILIAGALLWLCAAESLHAETVHYQGRLAPEDYLLNSNGDRKDPVFDKLRTIQLGVNLGIGSDCGRIDFKSTLQASLQNILDTKYFGDMGRDIIAASPMLLTCYFSPTWCAILKHSQVNANWLSQMRLNQCSLIDKYVDSRVDDFYQERQSCVRRSIDRNGGNMEAALESCSGNNVWRADLSNWAGSQYGSEASTNRLLDSSAKWAGLDQPENRGTMDLVKSMVGDTVVSHGNVSVEYGPRSIPLTPRTYLQSVQKVTYDKLCGEILPKVVDRTGETPVDQVVTDADLQALSPNTEQILVDRQTIRSLSAMGFREREIACQKLSEAVAMTVFSVDVNRSLDVLSTLAQNPNLPPNRKAEIEQKRKMLKDQVDLTLELHKSKNEPLNNVLSQINQQGSAIQGSNVHDALINDANTIHEGRVRSSLMDCSDGVLCDDPSGR